MNPAPAPAPAKSNKKVIIIVLVIVGLGFCCTVGTLAAIAIPNFLKFQQKAKQAEVKLALRMLLTAEETFQVQEGTWATDAKSLVDYVPSASNKYTCFVGPEGRLGGKGTIEFNDLPPDARAALTENLAAVKMQKERAPGKPGVEADFTIVCAANLDSDPELDVWSIRASDSNPRQDASDL